MPDFDPYYKWLAIPPAEQPPHYYRLLGLALFEPDLDVISAAADRQMAHIRNYQHSAHSQESQRVLNELAQARLTLLKPDTKARYDAELRQKLATSLPRAKPLKVAMPLDAPHAPAATLPPIVAQPAPHPHPQPHPQPQPLTKPAPAGLIRPQTMPSAAQTQLRPAPQSQPRASTATAAAPAAAAEPGPSPQELRRAKQRRAMFWSVFGVFAGGVVGTYFAGLILNFLGAPIPDGVRFLPGLGEKVAKKDTDNNNGSRPRIVTDDGGANGTTNAPDSSANPWAGGQFSPITLGPGRHRLSLVESNGNYFIQVTRSDSSPVTSQHRVGSVSRIFGAEVRTEKKRLYISAKPGGFATLVLPITAQPGSRIQGGRIALDTSMDANDGSMIQAMISRDFNFNTWDKPASSLIEFPAATSKAYPQRMPIGGNFTAAGEQMLYFVVGMTVGAQAKPNATRLYLSPSQPQRSEDIGEVNIASSNPAGTGQTGGIVSRPPAGNVPTAESLRIIPSSDLEERSNGKTSRVDTLLVEVRQRMPTNDPGEWLLAASKANDPDLTCALLLGAAEHAVSAGDVILASTAFQRLNRRYSHDFTTDELQALAKLYQQAKPGFQPAAYAAWGVEVLERMGKSQPTGYKDLAKRAYQAAVESGDRDLIQRATLHVAGASP